MVKFRFLVFTILILGIAFFTSWLLSTLGESPLVKTDRGSREPDYYFDQFVATSRDKQGRIQYRLEATQLEHFPYNRSMKLDKPYIELFSEDERPWQTWAKSGIYYERQQKITLSGQVRIHHAADEENKPVTLITENVTLDIKNKIARTDKDIQITSGEDILSATGMMVDMATGRVELHSKVQGKYELPKNK